MIFPVEDGRASVVRVGKLLHPASSKGRFVIVLKAYLDASGTDRKQKVVTVAGWAASEQEWIKWETEWNAFLVEVNLSRWHHTHFLNKECEYENWEEAKFLFAQGEIVRIFNNIQPFGVGAALWRSDYKEVRVSKNWDVPRSPYAFCLDYCLEKLIHKLHEVPKDEGIAIYVDQDDEYEDLGRQIAKWHELYLRQNKEARNPERRVSTTYGSSIDYKPLQAADILANETYRYMYAETGIPFLGATMIGKTDTAARPIIEAIKKQSYLSVELFSKRRLEWQADWKINDEDYRLEDIDPESLRS
jgi:Protein of unknown function (DUF3800)